MRRLLRDIAAGRESAGDTTTLEDISVLAKLREQEEETARRLQAEILAHQQVKDRLSYETLHDPLTGLPNRALLVDRLVTTRPPGPTWLMLPAVSPTPGGSRSRRSRGPV